MSRILPIALLPLLLSACDNGGEPISDGLESACSPIVKFANPAGVTPTPHDGRVTLTLRAECAEGLQIWAWPEEQGGARALDVFERAEGDGYEIVVPVDENSEAEACEGGAVVAALVDDYGDIVDQDRAWLRYAID